MPNFPDSVKIIFEPELDSSVDCGTRNDGYSFNLAKLPLIETKAFLSEEEPYLSHAENVNMILFLVVSLKPGGLQEISYVLKPVTYPGDQVDLQIKPSDFKLISDF